MLNVFKNQKGVALILTFIFMVSLTIVIGSYLFLVTYETRSSAVQSNNIQALYFAESALNHAVYYLTNTAPDSSSDGSWRTTAYPAVPGADPTDPQQESLGNGTYTMWVETSGSDILVTGRGTVGGILRIIQETIILATGTPAAFNYASYSDGSIEFNSTSGTVTGDLATTGTVDNEGGMTIAGTITESSGVAAITVSTSDYAGIAGTSISGDHTFTAGTYSGIYYVDGNVTIDDSVTFNGTVVATGSIDLERADSFTSTPTDNYPALVSDASVNADRMENSTINGLVYAATQINMSRLDTVTIEGSLISSGDIDLDRGSTLVITYDLDLASDPPPYFSAGSTTGAGWDEI